MNADSPQRLFRAFLYGGATMLLGLDLFFLLKAVFTENFVPIVPVIAGILTAGGLLFIVYAEQRAREDDQQDHRRISRVAHQLESPLHTLQEDLEHLMVHAETLPADVRLKLKRMETKTKVLLENIRDVFLALRVVQQPVSREMRVYNLCSLVDEVIREAGPMSSARNVELIYKPYCEEAPVFVDRSLFSIALMHVVENAILYTHTPGLVNIAVVKSKNRVRVVVQDRGIGIFPADAGAVFRPFVRGQHAEQFDPDGIGVGLTLAQWLVREWDGKLTWRDRGKATGSQFEISLPLAKT